MIHCYDVRDALRSAEPKHWNSCRFRNRIAVKRDHFESVSRKSEASNLCGAAVEDVKKHAFACFDANGLAVTEHAAVDGERAITHFEPVRHTFGKRSLNRGFPRLFEGLISFTCRKKILRHVPAARKARLKLFEHEENFAIVTARIVAR